MLNFKGKRIRISNRENLPQTETLHRSISSTDHWENTYISLKVNNDKNLSQEQLFKERCRALEIRIWWVIKGIIIKATVPDRGWRTPLLWCLIYSTNPIYLYSMVKSTEIQILFNPLCLNVSTTFHREFCFRKRHSGAFR